MNWIIPDYIDDKSQRCCIGPCSTSISNPGALTPSSPQTAVKMMLQHQCHRLRLQDKRGQTTQKGQEM